MNSIKKLLCLMCAIALVLALSACGGSEDVNSADMSSEQGSVDYTKPEIEEGSKYADPNWNPYASIPESIKGTTVRFATWIDHTQTEGAVPLSTFTEKTGLGIELFIVPESGYVNNIMTKMAAGDIPDVFVNNSGSTDFPVTLQIAAPINKVSTVDLQEPIWDQSMLDSATIEGNIYMVNTIGSPWMGSNLVYYNKRIFAENGFKTPEDYFSEGKWTWDNLLKCAKNIKTLGEDYKGVYVSSDDFISSLSTGFMKYDSKTGRFSSGVNDARLLEGYQWYADARDEGLLDGSVNDFMQGKCALVVRGPYGLKTNGYFIDMDQKDIGYTYLPSWEEGEKFVTSAVYRMYGIVDGAPNADAGGYFIRYWLDPANYDLANAFISVDAGNFYYGLTDIPATEKYFPRDYSCLALIGEASNTLYTKVRQVSSAGVKTAIDEVSNVVDRAVNAANEVITKKLEADRAKYQ